MPKTRHTKRSGSASSGKSEKRVKRIARIAPGENKAGLTPAIPFCEAEKDANDADDEYVSIKVLIDPGKAESRSNLEEKKFRKIIDLTYNGPLIVQVRRSLDLDLFGPQALTGREHTFTRLGYFERLLTGNAKDKFCKIYKMVSVMMLTKWDIDKDDPDQFRALQGSRTLFNQWVFEDEELNAYELSLPVEEQEELTAKLTTGHESAEQFEKLLWFELGKLIWKDHRQVYHDHIEYLQQSINKPFKWPMVRYISRIREMFDYCLYLQPHSFKDQSFKEACWDERDKPAPEKLIRKAIKDGLPEDMQNELSDKETDYREMSEEKLMDTLTTIEQKDERDRAAYKEAQDEVKAAQTKLRETSEPRNGNNPNKRRKQSNDNNSRGTARFCSLCKNAGMPERKYMSHSNSNCEDKEEMARRAMGGGMADQSQQVRKYKKESKALQKKLSKMQSRKKKLSKMSKKKSSDSREIRKLRKKFAECMSSSDESEKSDGELSCSTSDPDSD